VSIFSNTFFPFHKKNAKFKHKALIGVGCNVGDCSRRFKKLFLFLKSHPKIDITDTSYLYKNPPFGYLEQDDFINSVIIISTSFAPMKLLNFLLYTEKKFNRKRSFKNAPRTLDLDIIMYDNIKFNNKRLNIPHPFFKQRDSVLLPLYLLRK
jgi:2-amino-4-hydroxy-6-hydroxymethyldihydropteridine diphosphokinase